MWLKGIAAGDWPAQKKLPEGSSLSENVVL